MAGVGSSGVRRQRTGRGGAAASAEESARPILAETREAILHAAQQRFVHYGYKKTTIDEIASDAGIGKGTVYLYFEGKGEIILTLILNIKRNISAQLEAIGATLGSPEDRLRRMIHAMITSIYDAAKSSPHGGELVNDIPTLLKDHPDLMNAFRAESERHQDLIARMLREGHESGRFDVTDAPATAKLMMTAFTSFFPPYVCPADPEPRSRAQIEAGVNDMMDLILRGIRRRNA